MHLRAFIALEDAGLRRPGQSQMPMDHPAAAANNEDSREHMPTYSEATGRQAIPHVATSNLQQQQNQQNFEGLSESFQKFMLQTSIDARPMSSPQPSVSQQQLQQSTNPLHQQVGTAL